MVMEARPHDPQVCGIDPCSDCPACKKVTLRYRRVEEVQDKLAALGIDPSDLADLLWMVLEDGLSNVVEKMVRDKLRQILKGVSLHARVNASSVDWDYKD